MPVLLYSVPKTNPSGRTHATLRGIELTGDVCPLSVRTTPPPPRTSVCPGRQASFPGPASPALALLALGETVIILLTPLSFLIETPTKGRGGMQQNDRTLADNG